jgi:hypothetical protein
VVVVLSPDSEELGAGTTTDYERDHPHDDPRQWGWHGQWGRGARISGWVVVGILLVMNTATNYQAEYHITLWLLAAGMAAALIVDRVRGRTAWRKR